MIIVVVCALNEHTHDAHSVHVVGDAFWVLDAAFYPASAWHCLCCCVLLVDSLLNKVATGGKAVVKFTIKMRYLEVLNECKEFNSLVRGWWVADRTLHCAVFDRGGENIYQVIKMICSWRAHLW